jgi:hypothetical protein
MLVLARAIDLDEAIRISHDAERRMGGAEFSVTSQQVLQLATRSRCSAYDCEFVVLARDLRVPFVTKFSRPFRRPPCPRPSSLAKVARSRSEHAAAWQRRQPHQPSAPRSGLTNASAGPSGSARDSSGRA